MNVTCPLSAVPVRSGEVRQYMENIEHETKHPDHLYRDLPAGRQRLAPESMRVMHETNIFYIRLEARVGVPLVLVAGNKKDEPGVGRIRSKGIGSPVPVADTPGEIMGVNRLLAGTAGIQEGQQFTAGGGPPSRGEATTRCCIHDFRVTDGCIGLCAA
jgi:hypothetical protein